MITAEQNAAHAEVTREIFEAYSAERQRNPDSEKTEAYRLTYEATVDAFNKAKGFPTR
jgi:hypothetical protein